MDGTEGAVVDPTGPMAGTVVAARTSATFEAVTVDVAAVGPTGADVRAVQEAFAADRLLLTDNAQRLHAQATDDLPFGRPRPSTTTRGPLADGVFRGFGYLLVVAFAGVVLAMASQLLLILVSAFIAVGLEPIVQWLQRRGVRRAVAVWLLVVLSLGALAGFLAAAIPPLVTEGTQLVANGPSYLRQLQDQHSQIGRIAISLHVPQRLQVLADSSLSAGSFGGILDLGRTALSYTFQLLVVVVMTIYFVADFPSIKRAVYRLVPLEQRPRAGLLGDELIARTGGYLLGNLLTSAIATGAQFIELRLLDVPFALLLSVLVGVFDLVPLIGATLAGLVVVAVTLALVSPTAAIITVAYLVAYRLFEDYWLSPRVMRRTVQVPPVVTIIAVLLGGSLLGIEGALIAVPVAAAIQLVVTEVVYPRTDRVR